MYQTDFYNLISPMILLHKYRINTDGYQEKTLQ